MVIDILATHAITDDYDTHIEGYSVLTFTENNMSLTVGWTVTPHELGHDVWFETEAVHICYQPFIEWHAETIEECVRAYLQTDCQ